MGAFDDIDVRRDALERSLDLGSVNALRLRIGKNGSNGLELRLEQGGTKQILPVRWTEHPTRSHFTNPENQGGKSEFYVAPEITEPLARDLREWQVNHADLNGRLFLVGEGLYVDREPREVKFRNPVSTPNCFTAKASRIVRFLLSERETLWTQDELVASTQTSRGYVSRILGALADEGYVEKSRYAGRQVAYRLKDFDRLLDAWAREDEFPKRVRKVEYSLLASEPIEIAKRVRDALDGSPYFFTQWIAAWLRKPYTTPPVVSAYVPEDVLGRFELGRKVSSGGNLWLLVPEDRGVFQGNQLVDGFQLVCDVQIYLDLVGSGLRGPEAADALRQWEGFAK